MAWDLAGNARTVVRASAGSYVARIPMLVMAQPRVTNGAFQQTVFRSSATRNLGSVPPIDRQLDAAATTPFLPDIQVVGRNLELPRTWSFSASLDRDLGHGVTASATYVHARTDNLFRFVNRNDPTVGSPFGVGTHPSGGGINALTVLESTARSRYHSLTVGLRGRGGIRGRLLAFDAHYTLAFDRSDDDNERDPFTFRYARASDLAPEYGWSDRDRRHQFSGYLLVGLPGDVDLMTVARTLSASPVSEQCGRRGMRATQPADRLCADGTILTRNTLRRDNAFATWDLRLSRRFVLGGGTVVEPILDVFNLTNADKLSRPGRRITPLQLRRHAPERTRPHPARAGRRQRPVLSACAPRRRFLRTKAWGRRATDGTYRVAARSNRSA